MKIFLAGENGKDKIIPFVHGNNDESIDKSIKNYRPYILDSFFYINDTKKDLMKYYGDLLLDSGAFTFMGGFSYSKNDKISVDFEEYIEKYAEFIVANNIEKFFELDVDSVVGYEKVKEYRKRLEALTNRQCIPVWHSTRGKDEYIKHCEEYPYVALGGIVGGEWKAGAEKYIPWFIREAHKRGSKIHGLGFTKLEKLKQYHFDSVDSTAWTAGNRFGFYSFFNGETIIKIEAPKGKRIKDSRRCGINNYIEWLKFQQYADVHL